MNWARVSKYAIRSDCGQYTICKVFVFNVLFYEAWRGKERIGAYDTADQAKSICEQDTRAAA